MCIPDFLIHTVELFSLFPVVLATSSEQWFKYLIEVYISQYITHVPHRIIYMCRNKAHIVNKKAVKF